MRAWRVRDGLGWQGSRHTGICRHRGRLLPGSILILVIHPQPNPRTLDEYTSSILISQLYNMVILLLLLVVVVVAAAAAAAGGQQQEQQEEEEQQQQQQEEEEYRSRSRSSRGRMLPGPIIIIIG